MNCGALIRAAWRRAVRTGTVGVATACCMAGAAEDRVALVIGNARYAPPLRALANPTNDAELMAHALADAAFDVIMLVDANRDEMASAIETFGARLESAGPTAAGLFYFAGHGVQSNGINYLIPVASGIKSSTQLDLRAVSAQHVLDRMELAGNRLNVVVLDACRNNPLPAASRSLSRGLAGMNAPSGSLIAFSTAPGREAADGDSRNSPYTESLAAWITEPGIRLVDVFGKVVMDVEEATRGRTTGMQTPWYSSSLRGEPFYFVEPADGTLPPAIPARPTRPITAAVSESSRIRDLMELAEHSLSANRLTTPAGDSAYHYYQLVFAIDPGNEDAQRGISRITDAYAALTRSATRSGAPEQARRYLDILTRLEPGHQQIGTLRAELDSGTAEPEPAPQPVAAIPTDAEGKLWLEVKDRCESRELRRYIDAYPDGRYMQEAWARLSECQLR